MTKVEIVALAERWQAKADRAMERYQEDGLARHNREREQAQDLADALQIAASAADDHSELVSLRGTVNQLAVKAHEALDSMSEPEQPSDRTILTGLARNVISARKRIGTEHREGAMTGPVWGRSPSQKMAKPS